MQSNRGPNQSIEAAFLGTPVISLADLPSMPSKQLLQIFMTLD